MNAISAAIIVLSGTLTLMASALGSSSREPLFNIGIGLVLAGLVGWVTILRMEK